MVSSINCNLVQPVFWPWILFVILGYINEGGKLNLARLEAYLETLGKFDKEFFNEKYDDLKFLEAKHNQGYVSVFNWKSIIITKKKTELIWIVYHKYFYCL